ncbi:MAG: hypothetical protein ACKOGA_08920, partial [Planctomycetaceae bacterium]
MPTRRLARHGLHAVGLSLLCVGLLALGSPDRGPAALQAPPAGQVPHTRRADSPATGNPTTRMPPANSGGALTPTAANLAHSHHQVARVAGESIVQLPAPHADAELVLSLVAPAHLAWEFELDLATPPMGESQPALQPALQHDLASPTPLRPAAPPDPAVVQTAGVAGPPHIDSQPSLQFAAPHEKAPTGWRTLASPAPV